MINHPITDETLFRLHMVLAVEWDWPVSLNCLDCLDFNDILLYLW